jgi:hypothetical protein
MRGTYQRMGEKHTVSHNRSFLLHLHLHMELDIALFQTPSRVHPIFPVLIRKGKTFFLFEICGGNWDSHSRPKPTLGQNRLQKKVPKELKGFT